MGFKKRPPRLRLTLSKSDVEEAYGILGKQHVGKPSSALWRLVTKMQAWLDAQER